MGTDSDQWFLEVNGKKIGPFTLEHIQGLLDDGEIRGYHQVTSAVGARWMSVDELLKAPRPSAIPTTTAAPIETPVAVVAGGSFQPPPRPELQNSTPVADPADPTMSLFSALQLVRDRQASTINPHTGKRTKQRKVIFNVPDVSALKSAIPPRLWMTALIVGIILGCITVATIKLLKPHASAVPPPPGSMTAKTFPAPEEQRPPVPQMGRHGAPPGIQVSIPTGPMRHNINQDAHDHQSRERAQMERDRQERERQERERQERERQERENQAQEAQQGGNQQNQPQGYPPPNPGQNPENGGQQQPQLDPNNPQPMAPPIMPPPFQGGAPGQDQFQQQPPPQQPQEQQPNP